MTVIPVRAASASYDVCLSHGVLGRLKKHLNAVFAQRQRKYFVVTSPEIWALWSNRFLHSFGEGPPAVLFAPAGEKYKRLARVEALATQLSSAGADRGSVLIAFGGGVVGDVTGFLAAIYMRGVEYVQIPTTFLAQVDSSVGGKTGVNLTTGKNLIGAFHQPKAVFVDIETLGTLPDNEFRSGLFESLKAGFIRDRALLRFMEKRQGDILGRDAKCLERVIAASIRMKAEVVGEDEREAGLRMILNFGHTVGHAIEAVAGFGKVLHGGAVGWGMIAALEISKLRGLPEKEYWAGTGIVLDYGLPKLPALSASKLLDATARDKKNLDGLRRFVLLESLGKAYVTEDVTEAELYSAILSMLKMTPRPVRA